MIQTLEKTTLQCQARKSRWVGLQDRSSTQVVNNGLAPEADLQLTRGPQIDVS